MAWHPLFTLVLAAMAVMGSPGPATISVTAVAAAFGARRSLAYLGGIILGTTIVLLAVATGVVAMLLSVPQSCAGARRRIRGLYSLSRLPDRDRTAIDQA